MTTTTQDYPQPGNLVAQRKRHVLRSVAVVLIIVVLLGVRWHFANLDPNLVIPGKQLPAHNAFDSYLAAGRMVSNSDRIKEAVDARFKVSPAEREALAGQNTKALSILRQALPQPYMDVSPRAGYYNRDTHYFEAFRHLANALKLDVMVRRQRGDWNGAVNSSLDCIQMGEQIPHGAGVTGELVGMACQSAGRQPIWPVIDHLNAHDTRAAIARLEAISALHVTWEDALAEERYYTLSELKHLFDDKPGEAPSDDPSAAIPDYRIFYMVRTKGQLVADCESRFARQIDAARRPYASHAATTIRPESTILGMFMPDFEYSGLRAVDSEAQNRLLLLTLALHAYRIDCGRYPESTASLSPSYLAALPPDPFALPGTFKYRSAGRSYLLYSIGPDGKDDGGSPIDDPSLTRSSNPDARYYVNEDSKGDIVASKNIW